MLSVPLIDKMPTVLSSLPPSGGEWIAMEWKELLTQKEQKVAHNWDRGAQHSRARKP